MIKIYTCTCKICGTVFQAPAANACYCSEACKLDGHRALDRDRRRRERTKLYGQSTKPPAEQICPICGKTFTRSVRGPQKYCSAECRHEADLAQRRDWRKPLAPGWTKKKKEGPTKLDIYLAERKAGKTNLTYGKWQEKMEKDAACQRREEAVR